MDTGRGLERVLQDVRRGLAQGLQERTPEQEHRPENMPNLVKAKRRRRAKNKVARVTRKAAR